MCGTHLLTTEMFVPEKKTNRFNCIKTWIDVCTCICIFVNSMMKLLSTLKKISYFTDTLLVVKFSIPQNIRSFDRKISILNAYWTRC